MADELRERYERVANDLAAWINAQPIVKDVNGNPTIAPVYGAHVLLCELIREKFDQPTPDARQDGFDCPKCGHRHTGRRFAFICIGCPCDQTAPPAPTPDARRRRRSKCSICSNFKEHGYPCDPEAAPEDR